MKPEPGMDEQNKFLVRLYYGVVMPITEGNHYLVVNGRKN